MSSSGAIPKLNHIVLVNSPTFSDVQFIVEKQQIFAHYVIIHARCPALVNSADKKFKVKKKKGITLVEIHAISHKILLEILGYIYGGSVEFQKFAKQEQLILQLNAAAMELGLDRLQWLCENYIRTSLDSSNIFVVLKEANRLGQKYIKQVCFHFVINHWNDFVSDKDAVKDLGIELFQSVVEVHQQSQTGSIEPLPTVQEPPNTFVEDFRKIYEDKASYDVNFKLGNEIISCHKAILSGQSSELFNLCSLPTISKNKEHPECIVVPGVKGLDGKEGPVISGEAFRCMLKFIYFGECSILPLPAAELAPFAKDYMLTNLATICEDIIRNNIDKDTALEILAVTYFPQMESDEIVCKELRQNSIAFILANLESVDLSALKKLDPTIALDILLARQDRDRRPSRAVDSTDLKNLRDSIISVKKASDLPSLATPPTLELSSSTSLDPVISTTATTVANSNATSTNNNNNNNNNSSSSSSSTETTSTPPAIPAFDTDIHPSLDSHLSSEEKKDKKDKKEKKEKKAKKEK